MIGIEFGEMVTGRACGIYEEWSRSESSYSSPVVTHQASRCLSTGSPLACPRWIWFARITC